MEEASKSMEWFGKILQTMLDNSFSRKDCVVAVGGGVVGDLSGFAAATFMRGINLENAVVIIDECQNMSVPIIKRIISRCHDNCKVICCGCQAQTDIPLSKSGFKQLIDHMANFEGCIKCELPISYRGKLAMHIDKL